MFLFAFYSHLTFLCHVNKSKAYHKPDKSKTKTNTNNPMTQKNIKTGKTLSASTGKTPNNITLNGPIFKKVVDAVTDEVMKRLQKEKSMTTSEINKAFTDYLLYLTKDATLIASE